jgi:hypothetical protein
MRRFASSPCPRCNSWLGGNCETQQATDWELRVAQKAAEAIPALQGLKRPAESSYIAANMEKLCQSFADGNLSKVARQIQIHHSNIRDWIVQKQSPSLSSLFRLSAVFGVPVLDWVTRSIESTATCFSALGAAEPKRLLRRCHLPAVRAKLESLINSDQFPPSSLAEICRALGTEQSFIARKYPDFAPHPDRAASAVSDDQETNRSAVHEIAGGIDLQQVALRRDSPHSYSDGQSLAARNCPSRPECVGRIQPVKG